jgi:hypothetical protein
MQEAKTPVAPDPKATADAQAGMNRDTAVSQQLVNMTNQVGPDGSLTYNQTGTNSYIGADGVRHELPQFTATTNLSPTGQVIHDTNQQTQVNLAGIGRDQSAKIGGILGSNVDLSNDAVENRLLELGSKRLDPRFARDEEALRTRLTNSGIRPGSAAWGAEMGQLGETKNDAINQLLLGGRKQAIGEILTERQTPINEIAALMGGSQVAMPSFINTPTAQVGGVDYMGAVNNNYNQQVQQQKIAGDANNAMLGGLFGMAGTLGTAGIKYSDRNLKTDIRRVGRLDNGLAVYSYRMKDGGPVEIGVMADEVQKIRPQAVHQGERGLMVDYAEATA